MALLSSGPTRCGVHASDLDIVPLHDGSNSFGRRRVWPSSLVWSLHLPSLWDSHLGCKTGELRVLPLVACLVCVWLGSCARCTSFRVIRCVRLFEFILHQQSTRSFTLIIAFLFKVGHAAMSRWTENGWMVCLGAGFPYAWWEDTCGLDFLLETQVRACLPTPLAYLEQVLPLEWLAKFQGESNNFILKDCTYFDPASPWYSLCLAHRQLLAQESNTAERIPHYPRSLRTMPKIWRLQSNLPQTAGRARLCNGDITIPADTTTTEPSDDVLIMPSFTGGHQVFLGKDASLQYSLEKHWLAPVTRTYRFTVKVATAHAKDTALLLKIIPKNKMTTPNDDDGLSYRLPLPYTKALWGETQSIEISLNSNCGAISLQREWTELYGISIKEIRLQPC